MRSSDSPSRPTRRNRQRSSAPRPDAVPLPVQPERDGRAAAARNVVLLDDATAEFASLSFRDISAARFAALSITGSLLEDGATIFARNAQGMTAKLQVEAGAALHIRRLVCYSREGIVLRARRDLRLARGQALDLASAKIRKTGGDLCWDTDTRGLLAIDALGLTRFTIQPGFDDVTIGDFARHPYSAEPIWIADKDLRVVVLRTGRGRLAKLLVEVRRHLHVRRLVVYEPDGKIRVERNHLTVKPGQALDVDSGEVRPQGGGNLRWERMQGGVSLKGLRRLEFGGAGGFREATYRNLLRRPNLRRAIVWVDERGTRSYDAWSDEERIDLDDALCLLELGRGVLMPGPPALVDDMYMGREDAWRIYLAHVAQSLWVEANTRTPWRLSENPEALAQLFDMRRLLEYNPLRGHHFFTFVMGDVTQWDPGIAFDFLVNDVGLGHNQRSTILRLVDWVRARFIHLPGASVDLRGPFASDADQYEFYFGYRGLPLVERMIFPLRRLPHVTAGCWGMSGFLAAVLRTVNIAVRHGRSTFPGGDHSRPEFFLNDLYFPHGDDAYTPWIRPGHNTVPIERVFMDRIQLRRLIDEALPRLGETTAVAALRNNAKFFIDLAIEFKSDYLLGLRCADIRSGATGRATRLWEALHQHYSDEEIANLARDCDRAIAAISGGCDAIRR